MKKTGYLGHLNELRKRILFSFVFFIVAVIFGFIVASPVIQWLKPNYLSWNAFALGDALGVYIKVATLIGFALSLPFFLYQIWAFVRPGLEQKEQKAALRFIPAATMLFFLGLSFGYFILFPMIIQFMRTITEAAGATLILGLHQYFSFLFGIVVPVAILFELPIVVIFLTRIRVLNPILLRKFRKYAYLLLVITATIITPPELITEILVAIPLLLLYEISVILSNRVYKKQIIENKTSSGNDLLSE